ncbi:hypothetical protein BY996DRAFT_6414232 [Phakopsora pachyrhizi]|nr:hypothetical protein BY996DRAFT_6414232 [Phakopsora pachyrhizi]
MTPHVSCVMCNLEANYTLHKKPHVACVRKKKCCTNSDDAILQPESKIFSTLTCATAEELEVHDINAQCINELVDQLKQQVRSNTLTQYFSVQDEVAEVMNFARQLAARICGSVRGQSKSLCTKSEAQNSAQFQDQQCQKSVYSVKSNFEQNLDVQAHIAASILLI